MFDSATVVKFQSPPAHAAGDQQFGEIIGVVYETYGIIAAVRTFATDRVPARFLEIKLSSLSPSSRAEFAKYNRDHK